MITQQDLPVFSKIDPNAISADLDALLNENRKKIEAVLTEGSNYSWDSLIVPIEQLDNKLNKFWSPIRHLHGVADNEALRKAYNECLQKITEYATVLLQDQRLYQAYEKIYNDDEFKHLNGAQQKVIENALRDFRLSGVGLDTDNKEKFKDIVKALTKVESGFEENVLDATHSWTKHITDKSELAGLPETAMALAKKNAADRNLQGWVITLDFPSYYPVMQYADSSDLRREVYDAYVTRASNLGPCDHKYNNAENMTEILRLKHARATLLEFETYAHYSLAKKMADTPDEVLSFLEELLSHSIDAARKEFSELQDFAKQHHQQDVLDPWDVAYYSEKLKHQIFDFTQEDLRPYFPSNSVLHGLFNIVNKLYGIKIKQLEDIDVWHPDVAFYSITDMDGKQRGAFYLDLFARQNKRGGAWMDECVIRNNLGEVLQYPVAYLSCNFSPPVNGQDSLLTHDEVLTLFHEFGHGLHHMLTLIDYPPVSGINGVSWDAVELPSQFMENWCWDRESLDLIGRHFQTGDPIPQGLYNKMHDARNFQSAMQMVRQLEFAIFDFRLHYEKSDFSQTAIQDLLDEVRKKTAVIVPPEYNRFQNSFTHIFSGGYAAGYYSYKWAEVLSADAFSKFEENGIFDRDTGHAFLHTILEQGGSKDALDLFVEFRGRKPSISPLLRHSGIQPRPQT